MSAGSPKITVRRVAALSLVSLWLAGCTSSDNPPAPVTSVNGNTSSSTNSGMLITPQQKAGGTAQNSVPATPQIQPVQPVQTQPTQIQPVTQQPVAQQPVQMQNGHIVYNRKYGDIPKGSYTGEVPIPLSMVTRFSTSHGLPVMISAIWHSAIMSPRLMR